MRSIRLKLVLTSFLVVSIPVYFLNRYAIESFDRFTSKALEEEMIGHAFMLGEQYKTMVLGLGYGGAGGMNREFAALLESYGPSVESELQVLSPDGAVLFDSAVPAGTGADASVRPEVAKAMAGRYGARWELTPDKAHVFYHCALPIQHDGRVVGIACVTRHTGQITKAIRRMIRDQRLAMVTALLFAALISAVIAQTMTYRLRKLTKAAMRYADGDAAMPVAIGGRDEIGELGRAFARMAADVEKRNQYNRNFMSSVVHELRTPITAIKGAAEVLEQGAADKQPARGKFLGNIQFEADRLAKLVGELNELTKLDAETLRGQKTRVDYGVCLREILERITPTLEQDHAAFVVSIPEESLPVMIMPGRIEQVMANLLGNAFRYTPVTGQVDVEVCRGADHEVLTRVRDSGQGIPAQNLDKVFDRFFTTERKDVPKDYGSGLGLAIARSIIENHQGRIWVESVAGQGACFTFSLPMSPSAAR